jgi:predicted acylesterase/phospholipase RssA
MDQIVPKKAPHEAARERPRLPGQVVLVFQGGGALGAYQGGVYQALHEAGIEPDWVVGTSIGALNGALIVGNAVASRLERLREFWRRVEQKPFWAESPFGQAIDRSAAYMMSRLTRRWLGAGSMLSSASSARPFTHSMACARRSAIWWISTTLTANVRA